MKGMTLKQFIQTIIDYDEIEFSYLGTLYDFQKELATDGQILISVWQCGDNPKCCYSIKVDDNKDALKKMSQNLIKAKIFLIINL